MGREEQAGVDMKGQGRVLRVGNGWLHGVKGRKGQDQVRHRTWSGEAGYSKDRMVCSKGRGRAL